MDEKRKIWAIAGVLPSGEGLGSDEGSLRRSEAERESWPDLGFASAKLSFANANNVENCRVCYVLFIRCFEDLSTGQMRTL